MTRKAKKGADSIIRDPTKRQTLNLKFYYIILYIFVFLFDCKCCALYTFYCEILYLQ